MNMPVDENMTVHFNTTLFSLIRESLSIKMVEGKLLLRTDALLPRVYNSCFSRLSRFDNIVTEFDSCE